MSTKYHCYTQTKRLPDSCSGGPYKKLTIEATTDEIEDIYNRLVTTIEKRIARLEERQSKKACDKSYLSGFEAKDGDVYFRVRIVFKLQTKLRSV